MPCPLLESVWKLRKEEGIVRRGTVKKFHGGGFYPCFSKTEKNGELRPCGGVK